MSRIFPVRISGKVLQQSSVLRSRIPQFEGQTKQKLGNSEARGAVDSIVSSQLQIFLEQNPIGKSIAGEVGYGAESKRGGQKGERSYQKKNPHWKACHCLESLQTVQTKIHPSVRSTS